MNNYNIELFSKGLFSSWCWYKPSNILFDCGEGVATHFGNRLDSIKHIMITHGHVDHIAGLSTILGARMFARCDKSRPINIFFPKQIELKIEKIIELYSSSSLYTFPINLHKIEENIEIPLSDKKYIKVFNTKHTRESVGYTIREIRTRLKPQYREIKDIHQKIKDGKLNPREISEEYHHNIFSYVLDNCGYDLNEVQGTDLLVEDCTFINGSDRERNSHNTLEECIDRGLTSSAKKVVLAHVSPRYGPKTLKKLKLPYNFKLHYGNKVERI